jgi:hypothetical protein
MGRIPFKRIVSIDDALPRIANLLAVSPTELESLDFDEKTGEKTAFSSLVIIVTS